MRIKVSIRAQTIRLAAEASKVPEIVMAVQLPIPLAVGKLFAHGVLAGHGDLAGQRGCGCVLRDEGGRHGFGGVEGSDVF